ncbi:hypothetical protein [Streptomyces sp. NPDC055085]
MTSSTHLRYVYHIGGYRDYLEEFVYRLAERLTDIERDCPGISHITVTLSTFEASVDISLFADAGVPLPIAISAITSSVRETATAIGPYVNVGIAPQIAQRKAAASRPAQ